MVALQRRAGNRAACAIVQRAVATRQAQAQVLQRYRLKPKLESEELDDPRLQDAVTAAEKALNVNVDGGDAVARLQSALRKLHYDAPFSGKYDADTQKAVARFQRDQGIPYPTGRQAGPKTLSALDEALLGRSDENRKRCARYEPDEREKSFTTPGRSQRYETYGKQLYLYNFGAGRNRMKKEHEDALGGFIREFDLTNPDSPWEIELIRGYTDAVDAEDRNYVLREARGDDVQYFLKQQGVAGAPNGQAADVNSYDNGCDPSSRSYARRVVVQVRQKKPKEPCDPQRVADARKAVASAQTGLAAARARLARAKSDEVRLMVSKAACGLQGAGTKGAEECFKAQYPEQKRVDRELREAPVAIRAAEENLARARAELRAAEQDLC